MISNIETSLEQIERKVRALRSKSKNFVVICYCDCILEEIANIKDNLRDLWN